MDRDLPFRKARRTSRDSSPSSRHSSRSSRSASHSGDNSGHHLAATAQSGKAREEGPEIALGARRRGVHQRWAGGKTAEQPPGVNIEHVREELEKLRHSGGSSGGDPAHSSWLEDSGVGAQSPLPAYGKATAAAEARAWSPVDYPDEVEQEDEEGADMFGSTDAEGAVYMSRKRPSSSRLGGEAVPSVQVDNGSVHAASVRSGDTSSVGCSARSHSGSTVYSWRGDAASPAVEGAPEFEAAEGPDESSHLADALKRPGEVAPGHIRAFMEKVVDGDAVSGEDRAPYAQDDAPTAAVTGHAAAPQWDASAWHLHQHQHQQGAYPGPYAPSDAYAATGSHGQASRSGAEQRPGGRGREGFGTLRFVRSQQSDAHAHATSSVLQERMRRSNPGVVDAMYSQQWGWHNQPSGAPTQQQQQQQQHGYATHGQGAPAPAQRHAEAGAAAGYGSAEYAGWGQGNHGMHDGHDLEGMEDGDLDALLEGGADALLDGDLDALLSPHAPYSGDPEGKEGRS